MTLEIHTKLAYRKALREAGENARGLDDDQLHAAYLKLGLPPLNVEEEEDEMPAEEEITPQIEDLEASEPSPHPVAVSITPEQAKGGIHIHIHINIA